MLRRIILGIDPGITTGMAAIDLHGNVLSTVSRKNFSPADIKRLVSSIGIPLIVAVDKASAPEASKRLAASFNCRLFCPENDLSNTEKNNLIRGMESRTGNSHEKDALASALNAHKHYALKFQRIDTALAAFSMEKESERAKKMLIAREAKNISEIIDRIVYKKADKPKEKAKKTPVPRSDADLLKKIRDLERAAGIQKAYIKKLEARVRQLENKRIREMEKEARRSRKERSEILRDREVRKRDRLIEGLRKDLMKEREQRVKLEAKHSKIKELEDIEMQGRMPVVPVERHARDAISKADREFGLKGRILWFLEANPSNTATRLLIAMQPCAVIGDFNEKTEERLKEAGIPVLDIEPERHVWYCSLSEEEVKKAIKDTERKSFLGWLGKYRSRI